jgi:hypothetical protein
MKQERLKVIRREVEANADIGDISEMDAFKK